jgi:hypothetical protein
MSIEVAKLCVKTIEVYCVQNVNCFKVMGWYLAWCVQYPPTQMMLAHPGQLMYIQHYPQGMIQGQPAPPPPPQGPLPPPQPSQQNQQQKHRSEFF